MKKFLMIFISVTLILIPIVVNASFSDLDQNHWAEKYINDLTNKKIINGYPDGTFKPEGTLTKGEFLKLIMTASLPELDFSAVETDFDHWAGAYVEIAESYGVLQENEININNINEAINRIDVIKILSLADINIRENTQKTLPYLEFNDIEGISDSELVLLGHAVAKDIISGYPDGTFKPNNNLTRAEASKILSVYISK